MTGFRTFHEMKRVHAVPMQPVVDPADWNAIELADVSTWSYVLSDSDRSELKDAVAGFRRSGKKIEDVDSDNFHLDGLAEVLVDVQVSLIVEHGAIDERHDVGASAAHFLKSTWVHSV